MTIEGAIEDIDISSASFTTAMQCKYHEQSEKFSLGKIYKPILLMLEHFSRNGSDNQSIFYHLFCHFPSSAGVLKLTVPQLEQTLATTSAPLKVIIERIAGAPDLGKFAERLTVEFGPSLEVLESDVVALFRSLGFVDDDIRAIIFPAALQRIVWISTKGNVEDRSLTRQPFIESLRGVKQATLTRWTKELVARRETYQEMRRRLRVDLSHNSRRRFFVIDPSKIVHFERDICVFIKRFVDRYSHKYLHDDPPLFVFAGSYDVSSLAARLHDMGVISTTGFVGSVDFRKGHLFRAPMIQRRRGGPTRLEFRVRLGNAVDIGNLLEHRPDDMFLINMEPGRWEATDVSVHAFYIELLGDLEYILQMRDGYE